MNKRACTHLPSDLSLLLLLLPGDAADYQYLIPDTKHDPDCSSVEHNKKGYIKPKTKKKAALQSESFYDIVTKSEVRISS